MEADRKHLLKLSKQKSEISEGSLDEFAVVELNGRHIKNVWKRTSLIAARKRLAPTKENISASGFLPSFFSFLLNEIWPF